MTYFRRRGPLSIFALISFVWAHYYIDDTNTTLNYSSGPKAAWTPYTAGGETLELLLPNGTYQAIDAFVCFNHTYRYAACFDTDTCLLTIPFTGSGITVYVYQAGPVGINASITIDGAHAQTNVLNAPPAPAYEITNVSMFDVQQLPSGHHTLDLLINDLFGSYSGMMFDYAHVNESLVANTTSVSTTTTSTAASTSTPARTPSASLRIRAIVGGVVGALALIVVGALAFLWIRRRRGHAPEVINLYSENTSSFRSHAGYGPVAGTDDPYAGHNPATNNAAENDFNPSRNTEPSSHQSLAPNRFGSSEIQHSVSALSDGQTILIPFTGTPSTSNSSGANKTRLVLSNDSVDAPSSQPQQPGHSPPSSRQEATPLLTDEQADFINSLHQNNVPAAAIARVMERMLADRHAGIREWERETRLARSNTMTTAPPSYDLVAEGG